jgi:aryl-alcohol dehydrogenase-like predicted oxidoreductase
MLMTKNDATLRELGKTGVRISAIGLGTWQLSKGTGMAGKYWPDIPDEEIKKIIKASLDGNINWFDTAELYGDGESEKALARSLKSLGVSPENVLIATKWNPMFRFAGMMRGALEFSISKLDGYKIALYQIHQPYSLSSIRTEMKTMAGCVKDELTACAGLSNYSAAQMRRAHKELAEFGIKLASNQVRYSLLQRKIEVNGTLEAARELGITIIAYSPLAQGMLSGKFHEKPELLKKVGMRRFLPDFWKRNLKTSLPLIEALRRIGEKHKASPSQVALNWLIHFHGDTVVAIPGATKVHQAADNVGALTFRLSKDEMNELDELSSPFKHKMF